MLDARSHPSALRHFRRRLAPYRAWLVLGVCLSVMAGLGSICLLALSGWFISAAAFAGLSATTAFAFNYFLPAVGVRFFALLRIVARYGERVVTHEVTFRILAHLRVWFYQKLEPRAPSILLRLRQGDILNRWLKDIESLDNLYIRIYLPGMTFVLIWVILACILPLFSSAAACWILGCLVSGMILVPALAYYLGQRRGAQLASAFARFRSQWVIDLQFLPETTSTLQRTHFLDHVRASHHALMRTQHQMNTIEALMQALMLLFSGAAFVGTLVIAIPLLDGHHLNGANLALLALGTLASFEIFNQIPTAIQYLGQTRAAAERLLELTESPVEIHFPMESSALPKDSSLRIDGLSFQYTHHAKTQDTKNTQSAPQSPTPLLDRLSFSLKPNEKLVIQGPSGTGKSTFIHLLTRALTPTSGQIFLGEISIDALSEPDLRRHMTVVSQTPYLFSNTLRENLRMGNPDASDDQLWEVISKVTLTALIQSLPEGLDTWVGVGGRQFSGGEQKRLMIARALLHNAPLWILDEPLEGLDHSTRRALLQVLSEALREKTVIWITHRAQDRSGFPFSQCMQNWSMHSCPHTPSLTV